MKKAFNLADMFEMVAQKVPDRDALVCGEDRTSFAELDIRANQMAHYLRERGVKPGDHVGLYMYNCNEYLEGMMACFKLRAVPVNVNYRYVQEELSYIFNNADMVAVIHHQEFTPHIAEIRAQVPELDVFVAVADASGEDLDSIGSVEYETALTGQSQAADFGERSDDDLFLLYTGGTTGMPKGVMWPHKNLFFAALGGGGWFHPDGPITAPEQIAARIGDFPIVGMALAPLMHGACWWYACIQLLAGNSVILNPDRSLDGAAVWDIVEREKVNSISIVGDAMGIPLLDAIKANPGRWDLSSVFSVGSGGAVFSVSKQQEFRDHFPNVFISNSFGSSESGNMGFDSGEKKSEEKGLGNVAQSDFMDVITDEEGVPHSHVKPGEMGIFARSGYIPVGYYGDPEKTSRTFVNVDGKMWLLTGDEARLEEDGSITIYGRGSNCINSGGEKIFPEEVEEALKAHPAVFDCLVVDTPDERFGSKVTAVVALRGDNTVTLTELQDEARKHVAGYKIPRELHVVAEIPRAPSGKPAYPKAKEIALGGQFLVG
ncbi:acyl-CoA synthetase [Halieaceae bacterium IMCC14734]|uniref:Acyl-CoA synthetase n=1 Tax=Candidatus Litorirhabdus singularis TaxID=2518993 RepID=A0ABT3THI5_9GAMM|nr:acyl-CoA synthetase [Candidatus Litorirhabdus singularis]MCX2981729.1 acyl-CoA synthetase [Candidatus Litorirhabdus singularis]